jgi:energy-coupling factor transport system substrate-specific component
MSSQHQAIKDMTLIAICASILFVQQLALSFLPNIQFSTLLVVLFSKTLGFKKTTFIITIHVLVVSLFSPVGTLNPIFIPPMFIAWMLVPILLSTVFRKLESAFSLSLFGLVFGFVYGWIFVPFAVYFLQVPFKEYFLLDIPFEIMMAISNFITILWLYDILKKLILTQKELHDFN